MTKASTALAITALLLGGALAAPAAAEESKPIQSGAASWYGPGVITHPLTGPCLCC